MLLIIIRLGTCTSCRS